VTYEPLKNISKDDPVTCAIYARDNNLLEVPGVNVSSMLSDVPMSGMLSRKHDVYDALDDVPIECTCGSLVHGMDNIPMFGTYDMVSCVTILRVGMRQQSLSIAKKRLDSLTSEGYIGIMIRR
jgi:hypothetical protein